MGAAQQSCERVHGGLCGLYENYCASHRDTANPIDLALDELIQRLFDLQDLADDGMLGEDELIQLNKKVIMLHKGKDVDKEEIRARYHELFRSRLSASGEPVPLATFRRYILELLQTLDSDKTAQCFIVEQWIAEADMARQSFKVPSMQSLSDVPYLLMHQTGGRRRGAANIGCPAAPAPISCNWKREGTDCSFRRELTRLSSNEETLDHDGLDAVDVVSGTSLSKSRKRRRRRPRGPPPTQVLGSSASVLATDETWGGTVSDMSDGSSLSEPPALSQVDVMHSTWSGL
jgi:hypothetical protein